MNQEFKRGLVIGAFAATLIVTALYTLWLSAGGHQYFK
jgi:hypothetical protein